MNGLAGDVRITPEVMMKRFALAVLALAFLAAFFGAPAVTHAAAKGALCSADKYVLAQGEFANVDCTGFVPLTIVNLYYVEPGGTAVTWINLKADANGTIAFRWGNGSKGFYSFALGTYSIVAQQVGLAHEIKVIGKIEISNVGTGDHVAGAYLVSDKATIDRSREAVTLTGWGFAPGEVVTVWLQAPALCGSYTRHFIDGKNGQVFENDPTFPFPFFPIPGDADISTAVVGDIKANSSGAFSFTYPFFAADCEGTWRFAARGNTSGLGAYADVKVSGPAVSTNALLVPSKTTVGAFNDTIQFWAYGFGANEILSCWTTAPDGRAVGFGAPGSLSQIKVGADGSGEIFMTTGSYIITRDDPYYNGVTMEPEMSEGALGGWNLTCRGSTSGTTAIASFTVHGYELNP